MWLLFVSLHLLLSEAILLGLKDNGFFLGNTQLSLGGVFTGLQAPNQHVLQTPSDVYSLANVKQVELSPGVIALEYSSTAQQYLAVYYNGNIELYDETWNLLSQRTVVFPEPVLEGACAWNAANGTFWLLGTQNLLQVDDTAEAIAPSAGISDLRWHNRLEVFDTTMQFSQFEGCPCELTQPRYLGDTGAIVHTQQRQLLVGYDFIDFREVLELFAEPASNTSTAIQRPNLVIEADVQYYINSFAPRPVAVDGILEIQGGTLYLNFDEAVSDGDTFTLYTFAELTGNFDDILVDATDSCLLYVTEAAYESNAIVVTINVESLCTRAPRSRDLLFLINF